MAGSDGRWWVEIGPLDVGGPVELTVSGENTVTFGNVLTGEVWLCSGQSNMAMSLSRCLDAEIEIAAAHFPIERFARSFTGKEVIEKRQEGFFQHSIS